ncbi:MAG: hypothetical protein V5B39_12625 [Accumulibacter sp.]|jgi:hypothetical protein|uniref:helix-turn-helix transcriptional regulator n=1 Tax=Accumulibacter sp. TaxID=2053492 RepID=UPI002FC348B7
MKSQRNSNIATIPDAAKNFDSLADSSVVSLNTASSVLGGRSRATLYRDHKAGRLPLVKIGSSTFVKVSDIRKLIRAA